MGANDKSKNDLRYFYLNNGVNNPNSPSLNDLEYANIGTLKSLLGNSSVPTVTPGSAAGAGATASVVGNNVSGVITLTTGTGVSLGGRVFTLNLADGVNAPNNAVMFVNQQPNNPTQIGNMASAVGQNNATLDLSGVALNTNATYKFGYIIAIS